MKSGRSLTASRLALTIAIMVAVFLPLSYFGLGYQKLAIILQTEAEANALFAAQIINANPDYWLFEHARLQEFLTHHSVATDRESRSIVNLKGNPVAWNQIEVSYPVITRSQHLYESGNMVGRLEITRSLRPLLAETILAGFLGCLLMAAIYFPLKKYVLDAREAAEKDLRESEERYRLLVSNVPAIVYKGYWDWGIDFFDDKIEELTGYRKEEFNSRGLNWKDVVLQEDVKNIQQIFMQALKTSRSYVREYRIKTKEGKIIWIQERSQIICHPDGRVDYVSGVFFDVTAHKEAQAALQRERDLARQYLDVARVMMVALDSMGRITMINKKGCLILGYDESSLLGRCWFEVCLPGEIREEVSVVFKQLMAGDIDPVEYYENPVQTKSGEVRLIAFHNTVLREDSRIVGILFSGEDITDRRQAEKALQEQFLFLETLIDTIPNPVFYKDLEGKYLRCNRAFEKYFGVTREKIVGKTVFELARPEMADEHHKIDQELYRHPGEKIYEATVVYADDSNHKVIFYKAPFYKADGKVGGLVGVMLDITQRKQAEEALSKNHQELQEATQRLEQSRNTLQLIIESIPARVFWKDRNYCYLGCNTLFAQDAGLSQPQELLGKDDFDMGWREQAEIYRADDRQVMESRCPKLNFVEPQTTPTGDKIWLSTSKVPLQGLDGEIFGVLGVYEDITHLKQVEEALREVQSRQKAILDNIPDIAWLKDRESRYIAANEPFALTCGFSREELVGKTDLDFWPQELAEKYRRDDAEVIRTGQRKLVEEPFVGADGKTLWIETIKTPVYNDQGEVIGTTGIARDFTARKQAADELRRAHAEIEQLFASITSILIGLTPDGAVWHWNLEAEKNLGLAAVEALGQKLHILPIKWDFSKLAGALAECRKKLVPIRLDNVRFRRQDGKDGFLGISISPIKEESGKVSGLILLGSDITERLILEMQLAQAQKLESIGQLAAGIAHEINTPIQYVSDNTRFLGDAFKDLLNLQDDYRSLLAASKAGAVAEDFLNRVEAAIREIDLDYLIEEIPAAIRQSQEGMERVANIVRAMKDFSHPGTVEKQAVDINKALESTITVARNEWKYVAQVVTDLDPSLPQVPCRPDEINQVFLNIIINAAHAIADLAGQQPEEKGTITIMTRQNEDGVEISISDTGGGIPEEIKSRIFDPFFTTKDVGKGTGQGLAISHTVIVDKHGGAIDFEAAPGQGTTFRIRLPLAAAELEEG